MRKHGQEWELYDMVTDRTELTDLSDREGVRVGDMSGAYDAGAKRCGVIPRDRVLEVYAARGNGAAFFWCRSSRGPPVTGRVAASRSGAPIL